MRISETDAQRLGIRTGDTVRVVTEAGSAETGVEVSDMMQPGHRSLPNGFGVTYPRDGDPGHLVGCR